jgi:spore coat polysaccharide biosynthesis protein SpsF
MAEQHDAFWRGAFGDEYTERNVSAALVEANRRFFMRALARAGVVDSVLELGANRALNLVALKMIRPKIAMQAVEINRNASLLCANVIGQENVVNASILDAVADLREADLVLSKGVLIHIDPTQLPATYDVIASRARKFVLMCEYYSPTPAVITYRGFEDRLFKRDFAGEFLDRHRSFVLIDYGFAYHRDTVAPQDDLTWFLMENTHRAC